MTRNILPRTQHQTNDDMMTFCRNMQSKSNNFYISKTSWRMKTDVTFKSVLYQSRSSSKICCSPLIWQYSINCCRKPKKSILRSTVSISRPKNHDPTYPRDTIWRIHVHKVKDGTMHVVRSQDTIILFNKSPVMPISDLSCQLLEMQCSQKSCKLGR